MNTIDDTDDIDLSSLDLDTLWLDTTETCLDEYASFYKKDTTSEIFGSLGLLSEMSFYKFREETKHLLKPKMLDSLDGTFPMLPSTSIAFLRWDSVIV